MDSVPLHILEVCRKQVWNFSNTISKEWWIIVKCLCGYLKQLYANWRYFKFAPIGPIVLWYKCILGISPKKYFNWLPISELSVPEIRDFLTTDYLVDSTLQTVFQLLGNVNSVIISKDYKKDTRVRLWRLIVGSLVLFKNVTLYPFKSAFARILEIIRATEGNIRVVKLKKLQQVVLPIQILKFVYYLYRIIMKICLWMK